MFQRSESESSSAARVPWLGRLRRTREPRPDPGSRCALTIEVGTATGSGPTEISAFDAALGGIGVADANLIRLSSVIPPRARVRPTNRVHTPINWGDRLYCVYAVNHARNRGEQAAAGLGWALRDDDSGAGLFVEHEAETVAEVQHLIRTSLAEMTRHRPDGFGPVQLCTSQAQCDGDPTCALVLAAYAVKGWGQP